MTAYREPGFQDRRLAAARARATTLALLKNRPPLDPGIVAERTTRQRRREADQALHAAQKLEARAEQRMQAQAVQAVEPATPPQTETERKAARDARYAARKARQS